MGYVDGNFEAENPPNQLEYNEYEGMNYEDDQEAEAFQPNNELKVIQEYNREEHMPKAAKREYWSMISKSMLLGFWENKDREEIFLNNQIIKMANIMSKPKQKYTFKERNMQKQLEYYNFQLLKRGIGMERHKYNERTLQSMSIQQQIRGGATNGRRATGGFMGSIKNMFQ